MEVIYQYFHLYTDIQKGLKGTRKMRKKCVIKMGERSGGGRKGLREGLSYQLVSYHFPKLCNIGFSKSEYSASW